MDLPADYHRIHLEGTMEGWYQNTQMGSMAKGAHWITFICLGLCSMMLFYDSWRAKGPGGRERFYAGYHEEYNISLLVNMFATIAYFGKIVADTLGHNYVNVGPFILGLGNYRYADYMLTCPMLAYDLLSQVRGPYKATGSALIFAVLMCGAATNFYPGDEMRQGAVAWFCFGCVMYTGAYALFVSIVRAQYERLESIAAGTEAKKAFLPLRLAIYTFFTMWVVFPLVWLLGEQGLGFVSMEVQEVLHCALDIVAKSFYGFALMRYRNCFDKKLFAVLEELGYDGDEQLENLEKDLKTEAKEQEKPESPRPSVMMAKLSGSRKGSMHDRGSFCDKDHKHTLFGGVSSSIGYLTPTARGSPLQTSSPPRLSIGPLDHDSAFHELKPPGVRSASSNPQLDQMKMLVEALNKQIRTMEMESPLTGSPELGPIAYAPRLPRTKLQSNIECEASSSPLADYSRLALADLPVMASSEQVPTRQSSTPTTAEAHRDPDTDLRVVGMC